MRGPKRWWVGVVYHFGGIGSVDKAIWLQQVVLFPNQIFQSADWFPRKSYEGYSHLVVAAHHSLKNIKPIYTVLIFIHSFLLSLSLSLSVSLSYSQRRKNRRQCITFINKCSDQSEEEETITWPTPNLDIKRSNSDYLYLKSLITQNGQLWNKLTLPSQYLIFFLGIITTKKQRFIFRSTFCHRQGQFNVLRNHVHVCFIILY